MAGQQLWSRVSQFFDQLPDIDRTMMEYMWEAMLRISTQVRFEVQNAMTVSAPNEISIYGLQYWKKFSEPWVIASNVYNIPTLQDQAFLDYPLIYIVDVDYTLSASNIVWTSVGPVDGDMELGGLVNWTDIGTPTVTKDGSVFQGGAQSLKIVGDAEEGSESDPFMVNVDDNLRLTVYTNCTAANRLDLVEFVSHGSGTGTGGATSWTDLTKSWVTDEHATRILIDSAGDTFTINSNTGTVLTLAAGTPASGAYVIYDASSDTVLATLAIEGTAAVWTAREIVAMTTANTRVTQTVVAVRAVLEATGDLYVDTMDVTRYPRLAVAFAPIVQRYNDYLDKGIVQLLGMQGVNDGTWTPKQAKHVARALNYSYRATDTDYALKVGLAAILGLPLVPYAGTVTAVGTVGSEHIVTIDQADGTQDTVEIDSSLCALTDLPSVNDTVLEFEPLLADALKIKYRGGMVFVPLTDTTYPSNGDMETGDPPTGYTAINGAVLSAETGDPYAGSQALKVVTDAVDEGVKPSANQSVTAGDEKRFEFQIKVDAGCVVRADVIDVTGAAVVTSEWFGQTTYEKGVVRFTVPAGCLNTRIEFVVINTGTFYVDDLDLYSEEQIDVFYGDKTAAAKFSTYADSPIVAGDIAAIRNLTTGTREVRGVSSVAAGSAPYTDEITLDDDLVAAYVAAYIGASGTGGVGTLTDGAATWDTDEHAGKVLIDGDDDSFPIISNNGTVLTVTGTPKTGPDTYIIVGDHQVIEWGHKDSQYTNLIEVYNRFTITFDQDNIDVFLEAFPDQGHQLTFTDVAP